MLLIHLFLLSCPVKNKQDELSSAVKEINVSKVVKYTRRVAFSSRSCCITELVGLFYNIITNFQLASFGYHNNWTILNIPASHGEQIQCVFVVGFVHLLQNVEFDIKKKASLSIFKGYIW